jgi:HEPN domain-containing protein
MFERDPDHWLYRLSPDEWLRAAEGELARARAALVAKQQRAGVAQARRAAGMAWNAVLALAARDALDEKYGRSYMDHLKALAGDEAVPPEVRIAARSLLQAPLQSDIVQLGPGDTRLADAAQAIVDHARVRLSPPASA